MIAMNAELHRRHEDTIRSVNTLRQTVTAERASLVERNDFLFQSLKSLERQLVLSQAQKPGHTDELRRDVSEILKAQRRTQIVQKEQMDLAFHAQKNFEISISNKVKDLTDAQETLRSFLTALKEREDIRWNSHKTFEAVTSQQNAHLLQALAALVGEPGEGGPVPSGLLQTVDDLRRYYAQASDWRSEQAHRPVLLAVIEAHLDACAQGETYSLWGSEVSHPDRAQLGRQLADLLSQEALFFSDDVEAGHQILCAGLHADLTKTVLQALYPNARVTLLDPAGEGLRVLKAPIDLVWMEATAGDLAAGATALQAGLAQMSQIVCRYDISDVEADRAAVYSLIEMLDEHGFEVQISGILSCHKASARQGGKETDRGYAGMLHARRGLKTGAE